MFGPKWEHELEVEWGGVGVVGCFLFQNSTTRFDEQVANETEPMWISFIFIGNIYISIFIGNIYISIFIGNIYISIFIGNKVEFSNCFSINLQASNIKKVYFTFFIRNCKYSFENTRPTVAERWAVSNGDSYITISDFHRWEKSRITDVHVVLRFFNWIFYPKQRWRMVWNSKQEKPQRQRSLFYTRRHREYFNVLETT